MEASRQYPSFASSESSGDGSNSLSPSPTRSGSTRSVPSFDVTTEPIVGDVTDALSPVFEAIHKVGADHRTVRHKHVPHIKIKEPISKLFDRYAARVRDMVEQGIAQIPDGLSIESWLDLQKQAAKLVQMSCPCC